MSVIHVGIGGWSFPPWRGPFYPAGLPYAHELEYASRHVTSIEINATFYGSQKPASFAKWRDAAPNGFVFSVKGPRFATHRKDLTAAADSIGRFLDTGVTELGPKLGPILWQFPPTRRFEAAELRPFLEALPTSHAGLPIRHVVEARHPSFADLNWMMMLQAAGVAHAIVDSDKHVLQADLTALFIYARLERNTLDHSEGYEPAALDQWTRRVRDWADGAAVDDLPTAGLQQAGPLARECFVYFIGGEKVSAPTAAQAMLRRLGRV